MRHFMLSRHACETARKLLLTLFLTTALAAIPRVAAAAQEPPTRQAAGEAEKVTPEGNEIVGMIARIVNFAILAGVLVYFLKSPLAGYLSGRSDRIREDLVNAEETRRQAAAQIAEIERRLQALPAELEALREQGAAEIAAEEARIRAAAAAERERLLDQARREIEWHTKVAERELVSHAADLAIGVAVERIKTTITDEDRQRLVDR